MPHLPASPPTSSAPRSPAAPPRWSAPPLWGLTKTQTCLAGAVLLAGGGGLILQHQTATHLRAANATLQAEAARLTAENRTLARARTEAKTEAARLRAALASQPHPAPPPAAAAPPANTSASLAAHTPLSHPRSPRQLAQLHERYDSFLRERSLSPADIDRWIALMSEKETIRLDLQAAMRDHAEPGGTAEIENLRTKLTADLWRRMFALLGPDGETAFRDFEQTSYYRATLRPLTPALTAANAPLSAAQSDRLVRLLAANDHPQRKNATDLGANSRIDWSTVIQQAKNFLSPPQLAALRAFAAHSAH